MGTESDGDLAELERQSAALDAEFARVGITWDALRAELTRHAADSPEADPAGGRSFGLLFEFGEALAALRRLPDSAGVGPFAAWVRSTPTWRAIWERAPDA